MTTTAKTVHGPLPFMALLAVGGYVAGKAAELAIKGFNSVREGQRRQREAATVYSVSEDGKSKEGLEFSVGEKTKVLATDGDMCLIERLGDKDSPYVVSRTFLSSISTYVVS